MRTPARNEDLRHVETGLSDTEKRQIHRRVAMVAVLGDKWLLHPANSPKRGVYDRNGKPLHA